MVHNMVCPGKCAVLIENTVCPTVFLVEYCLSVFWVKFINSVLSIFLLIFCHLVLSLIKRRL